MAIASARARTSRLPPLLPEPRRAVARDGRLRLSPDTPIVLPPAGGDGDALWLAATTLRDGLAHRCRLSLPIESPAPSLPAPAPRIALELDAGPGGGDAASAEAYRVSVDARAATVAARTPAGIRHGIQTLLQLVDANGGIPACEIDDAPDFARRGIMLDVSRGKVPDEETLRRLVDLCVHLKLNVLMLYVEHTFRFRRHPRIGTGASPLEAGTLRALDDYAAGRGVELVPCLQSLGHMENVLCWPEYAGLEETDLGWTVSPADPATYELIGDLYGEFLPNFRSPLFNANCDEPWDLGRGRSAERAAALGPGGVYLEHVSRIRDLAARLGKRTMIWGDVVHAYPERIPEIDRDLILLDWWYEAGIVDYERVAAFARNGIEFWVCPGTSSWNSLFPRVDNSLVNIARWADAGRRHGASGLLVTDWGDFGHYNLLGNSLFAYAWAAQQAWSGDVPADRFDRAFSRRLFGDTSSAAARLYRALGAIHDPGFAIFNGSALQYLYFDDVERGYFVSGARPAPLRRCERALRRVLARLDGAERALAADPLTRDELRYAARASLLAVRKTQEARRYHDWRRGQGAKTARERRALAARLRELADEQAELAREFRRLWLARSRPSNIEMTLSRVQRSVRSLRAAASRLARNRPSPPPPPHVGFRREDVIAELRRGVVDPATAIRRSSRGAARERGTRRSRRRSP